MFEKWLTTEEFAPLSPINVFSKELVRPNLAELHPPHLRNIHMLVRGTVSVSLGDYDRFFVHVTADDYYKMKLNGTFITQGPASGYYFHYNWNRVDVTDHLRDGENKVELEVYYQGLINHVWNSGDLRMGFAFSLYGEKNGVSTLITEADEAWMYAISRAYLPSHTVGYDTQFMENFDTRLAVPAPEEFRPCVPVKADYTFAPEPVPTLMIYDKPPQETIHLPGGAILCDMRHEVVGTLVLKVKGKEGSKLHILCGEELVDGDFSPDAKVRHEMRCNCDYREFVILSGETDTVEQYDYKAFRYFTLVPEDPQTVIEDVVVRVRHWPFNEDACVIQSNDPVLDSVFNLCKRGAQMGAQEVFVDCPSREKGQYSGDMTVTALSNILLTGDVTLARKGIGDQFRSARVCPGLMSVAPGSLMQEIADYSLQLPILILRDYHFTKDADFMGSAVPYLDEILGYFRKYAREDGMLDGVTEKWNLVDYPENLRDDYDFPLTRPVAPGVHNVMNAFYVGAVLQTEKIKDILGIPHENQGARLRDTFNKVFFDFEKGLYTDSETSSHSSLQANMLAPYYGLVPKGYEQSVGDFMVSRGLRCGVYMSFFFLKSLCALGRYGDAYRFVTSKEEASWYNMVREGGTCCFEAWGKDKKWNTSLCHPWASAPVSVIIEDLIGLHPDGSCTPHLPKDVHLKARLPVTLGEKGFVEIEI